MRMFIVLIFYYDFFNKGVDKQSALPYLQEFFRLLNLKGKEKRAVEMLLDEKLMNMCVDPNDEDTITQLFKQSNKQEDSNVLRHCLINMLAVTLSLPSNSNHLYTHIFTPGAIANTFGVGNQYSERVLETRVHYDCGCELSSEGAYNPRRPRRSPFDLSALYPTYILCFGGFALSLLIDKQSHTDLLGPVISKSAGILPYQMVYLPS